MSEALVHRYFDALARLDGEAMAACYHPEASFSDPVFADLRGERVGWRWRMLTRGARDMHLDYVIVFGDERKAQVEWKARYRFAGSGRVVRNQGLSTLTFWDERIVRQVDEFDFWRWSRSSVGLIGMLFGGLAPVRSMVQRRAAEQLDRYIARSRDPASS
jgi:ketosteroid isomerase-like protein